MKPDEPQILPIDTGPASTVVLAVIIGACGVAIAVVLAASHLVHRVGTLERTLDILTKYERCEYPAKPGDLTTITVRNTGAVLLTRCQTTTDWRQPERITP